MSDIKLSIRINADGSAAVTGIQRVDAETKKLGATAKQTSAELGAIQDELKDFAVSMGVVGLALFVRQIGLAGDSLRAMNMSIQQVSGNVGGLDDLYQYAQKLGIGLSDARDQLNQFVPALGKAGLGFRDAVQFATDLTNAMRSYGVQGQAAASVTLQLGQALSGGTLNGDELMAIAQNAGGLGIQLEKVLQRILGTQDSLKKLGEQGLLTRDVMTAAFSELFADLRPRFDQLPQMLEQQEARFRNAAERLFGEIDKKLMLSEMWQFWTKIFARNVEAAGDVISGSPVAGYREDGRARFDALVGRRMGLKEQLDTQNQRLQDLLPGEGIKPGVARDLAVVRAEIKDTTDQLARVETEIRRIQDAAKEGVSSGAKDSAQAAKDSAAAAWQKVREQYDKSDEAARKFADGAKIVNNQLAAGDISRDQAIEQLRWLKTVTLDAADGTGKLTKAQEEQRKELERYAGQVAAVLRLGSAQKQTLMDILPVVDEAAKRYGLEREAILSVINAESSFRKDALSPAGAKGLMQITPPTADWIGSKTGLKPGAILNDPNTNIDAGSWYLNYLQGRFGSLPKALWGYNAGPAAAEKGRLPQETQAYIDSSNPKSPLWALDQLAAISGKSRQVQDELEHDAQAARDASAEQVAALYQASTARAAITGPMDQYLAGLKAEAEQAGMTAEQQARANAETKIAGMIAEATARQLAAAQAAVADSVRTGQPADMSQANAIQEGVDYLRARKQEAIDAAAALTRVQEKIPTIGELWTETVKTVSRGIQGDLASAFDGLFTGTLKSADDFITALKKTILSGLAKLAAAIAMQPINVVINTVLGSAAGLTTSGASAGTTSTGTSGSSILSSLGSLVGGNSIGAGLAGSSWFGGVGTQAGTALAAMPNWAYGASGIAGGLIGSYVAPNSPYGSLGGSVGGLGGMVAGTAYGGAVAGAMGLSGAAAGAMAGSVVPVIGTIIGAIAGAVLGGALGGGKDDTPQKEAYLAQQKQRQDQQDALAQSQQDAVVRQAMSEEAATTAAIAAQYDTMLKYHQEVARQEQERLSKIMDTLQRAASELQARWKQSATTISQWTAAARGSIVQTKQSAGSAYRAKLVAAQAGDQAAVSELTTYADRYLTAAKSASASKIEYQRVANSVLGEVSAVGADAQSTADRLAALTEQTNQTLQDQYATSLMAAKSALGYYESSGMYDQRILDAIRSLDVNVGGSSATPGFAVGGIASGPTSGYDVTLHGTEAVIPLGKGAVPVAISWEAMIAELRAMSSEIDALRVEQQRQHHASYVQQRDTAETLRRWEAIGQPQVRA